MAKYLYEFIQDIAHKGIKNQSENGSMPAGHNGPYFEKETPVRNTGHWLIIFSKAYQISGQSIYINAVQKASEYLCSKEARPKGASFHHRIDGADGCNGVIGAAWTIEALVEASKVLGDDKYLSVAEDVFLRHPFVNKFGVWKRLEFDGTVGRIDQTFNHQLWFAACSSYLINGSEKYDIVEERVLRFLEMLTQNIALIRDGLIYHSIIRKLDLRSKTNKILNLSMQLVEEAFGHPRKQLKILNDSYNIFWKSIGYHSFNTFAFAMIKYNLPDLKLWDSSLVKNITDFLLEDSYKEMLSCENYYGFPYNPPGFEVPVSLSHLTNINNEKMVQISNWWINEQLDRHYNSKTGLLDRETCDPMTLTARVYELYRLPDYIAKNVVINYECI